MIKGTSWIILVHFDYEDVQDGILKELRFLTVLKSCLFGQLGLHHLGFLFYGLCGDVSRVQHISTHSKQFEAVYGSFLQSCTQRTEPEQILLPRQSRCSKILENLHVPLAIQHGLCVLYCLVLPNISKHTNPGLSNA